jgi:hypothetical protein
MKNRVSLWISLLALLAVAALPLAAFAADPPKVAVVISVKVNGDRQVYLDKLKALQAINKRLGTPMARVWRETFGGEGTDTIHIVTEYASLTAMSEAQAKSAADAEATKFLRDLDASGIRTVLSRSLMVDDTPK